MKRFHRLLAAAMLVVTLAGPLLKAAPVAAAVNLIANPSVETASGTQPAGWSQGGWGTNKATYTYATSGQDGSRSLSVAVSGYTNGDAKWYFTPVTVTPGMQYTFSNWYQATAATELDAQITDTTGQVTYAWLGSIPASAAWKQNSLTWTAPANAKTVTFFHVIAANGTLSTDNFSLTSGIAPTPTPTPSPSATPTATPTPSPSTTPSPTPSATPTPVPSPTPTPVPGAGVPNPSLETANGSTPQSWTGSGWGTNTAVYTYENTGHTGSRSVKVNMTSYTNGSGNWYYAPQAVQAGGHYRFTDWYQSNATTEIDAEVTMSDGTVTYHYLTTVLPSTAWAQSMAEFDVPAGAVSISVFHLIAAKGFLVTDDYSFGLYKPAAFTRGLVTITFDDGWTSQYTNGFPLLKKYGLPATFYVLSGELTNQPDYMTVAQMKALIAGGNELASHTVTHTDLTTVTATKLTTEMKNSQATLQTKLGVSIPNFAYPYGAYNGKTITEGLKYYGSQRSTDTGYNTKDNLNVTTLKVQNIYSTTTSAQVQAWVDQASRDKTWLILVYHEVATVAVDPSDDLYTTQPADLDKHLAIIKNSGLGVLTLQQALTEIKPQVK